MLCLPFKLTPRSPITLLLQIHTSDGEGYGEGNLGVKGMALFFGSHHHDSLCEKLKLREFALAPAEKARNAKAGAHVLYNKRSSCISVQAELTPLVVQGEGGKRSGGKGAVPSSTSKAGGGKALPASGSDGVLVVPTR
jgi:hypothetical protein